jgi:hypothetical protein
MSIVGACVPAVRFSRFDPLQMVCGAEGSLKPLWSGLSRLILSPARLPFHHSGTRAY